MVKPPSGAPGSPVEGEAPYPETKRLRVPLTAPALAAVEALPPRVRHAAHLPRLARRAHRGSTPDGLASGTQRSRRPDSTTGTRTGSGTPFDLRARPPHGHELRHHRPHLRSFRSRFRGLNPCAPRGVDRLFWRRSGVRRRGRYSLLSRVWRSPCAIARDGAYRDRTGDLRLAKPREAETTGTGDDDGDDAILVPKRVGRAFPQFPAIRGFGPSLGRSGHIQATRCPDRRQLLPVWE